MKLKRLLALSAAAVMAFSGLAGCGSGDSSTGDNGSTASQGADASNGGDTSDGSSAAASDSSEDSVYSRPDYDQPKEMRDISAWELCKEFTYGWNLGNTMDARASGTLNDETAWQPDKTNEEMMKLLAKDGFNVVRIPVSWDKHMKDHYSDYKVSEKWMKRVREIVDYAIDNGLYVILNTHHEEWYFPNEENKEEDIEQLKALWTQIADEFQNYDEHLIFEGLNEPRLRGTPQEWNAGTAEGRAIVAEYEKVFYETVRNSGGNNPKRMLMMTGYAAASDKTSMSEIYIPENDDKVIVSVHAYTPYNFALDPNGTDKYPGKSDIEWFFKNVKELFIDKQIPVIVGEYGAMNRNGNTEERVKWLTDYLTIAKETGVTCVWWDNNAVNGNGENFGIMNRKPESIGWVFPELVEAMKQVYGK